MEILLLVAAVIGGYFIYQMVVKDKKPTTPANNPNPAPEASTPVAPYKVEPQEQVQPVVENKVDPVSVALDLEPMAISEPAKEAVKKPRKPRAPKAEKPAKEKAAKAKPAAKKTATKKTAVKKTAKSKKA